MKSTKAVDESHSLSYAAIIGNRDGTEGTNSHIRDITARRKMSGNRFGVIVIVNRPMVFSKPYVYP